jgi:hypothetical protein
MKKLILLLILVSITALAQKPKYITVTSYSNGKAKVIKQIPYPKPDTVYKVVTKVRIKRVPKIVKVPVYSIVTIPSPPTAIDTLAIIEKYHSKNIYKETIKLPNNQGWVFIVDTLAYNRHVGRHWHAEITPRFITKDHIVVMQDRSKIYFGASASTNFNGLFNFWGANLLFKSKDKSLLHVGAGMSMRQDENYGMSPYLTLGYYVKIK